MKTRILSVLVALCCYLPLSTSCGDDGKPRHKVSKTSEKLAYCDKDFDALSRFTAQILDEGFATRVPAELKLAPGNDPHPTTTPQTAATLAVWPQQYVLDGETVESAKLQASLEAKLVETAPKALGLQLDQQATWSQLIDVTEMATKAGYDRVVFYFTAQSELAKPPASEFANRLKQSWGELPDYVARLEPQPNATQALEQKLFANCPKAIKALKKAAAAPRGHRFIRLAERLLRGIKRCNCDTNLDDVRALLWHYVGRDAGLAVTSRFAPLAASDHKKPEYLHQEDGEAKWKDVSGYVFSKLIDVAQFRYRFTTTAKIPAKRR